MLTPHTALLNSLSLALLSMNFGEVERATQHPDGRPETDTTHTVMLGLLATQLAPMAAVPLDVGLVAQFALVHDLVEAHAGDTNTAWGLWGDALDEKQAREAAALDRIRVELPGFPGLALLIERYEAQDEPEARFVRYLDKVLPKLTHLLNKGAALRDIGMNHTEMLAKHIQQGLDLETQYPEFTFIEQLFYEACDACEREFKPISCDKCRLLVEDARRCYATPTCYACLPPPEPLQIAPLQSQEALSNSEGAQRIEAERLRQMEDEGWNRGHDAQYINRELLRAALTYIGAGRSQVKHPDGVPVGWPWDAKWWKPSPENRIRELEKAGALVAAEIDRLIAADREEEPLPESEETASPEPEEAPAHTAEEQFAAEHDHPSRYQPGPYEAIKVIEAWGTGFCIGNALKYLCRHKHKGTPEDDLRKALWYVERALENPAGAYTLSGPEQSRAVCQMRPPEVVEAWGLSGTPAAGAVINLALAAPEHAARNIREQLAQLTRSSAA